MECAIQAGDDVVCVNHDVPDGFSFVPVPGVTFPTIGEKCKVRSVAVIPAGWADSGMVILRLVGHVVPSVGREEEAGYPHFWFRRAVDTTKQVEAMKQMMLEHVANASGGLGITPRKVRA
jgi:hypothetical protein